MGDPYAERTLAWVPPFTGSTIKYGFLTNMSEADSTTLGHTRLAPGEAKPTGLVIGANAPKPWRATRIRADGSESSFIAPAAVAAALGLKWKITSRGKIRLGTQSARSKSVYVKHQGNSIAWRMPNYVFSKIPTAELTALGIILATATDQDLCFGCSYPRLPRAASLVGTAPNQDRISTFYDPSKPLPDNWFPVKASTEYVAPAGP